MSEMTKISELYDRDFFLWTQEQAAALRARFGIAGTTRATTTSFRLRLAQSLATTFGAGRQRAARAVTGSFTRRAYTHRATREPAARTLRE